MAKITTREKVVRNSRISHHSTIKITCLLAYSGGCIIELDEREMGYLKAVLGNITGSRFKDDIRDVTSPIFFDLPHNKYYDKAKKLLTKPMETKPCSSK